MANPENRLITDLDPEEVEGKVITRDDITTETWNALARRGWLNWGRFDEIPAGALAEATEGELIRATLNDKPSTPRGLGPKRVEEIRQALLKLRNENDKEE